MNPFIGQPKAQLESWLRLAQSDLAHGKTISQAGAGDANMSNEVQLELLKRIEYLLAALNLLDPITYPASSTGRVSRTKIRVYPNDDYQVG